LRLRIYDCGLILKSEIDNPKSEIQNNPKY
jgi:hypothetical protein